MNNLMIIDNVDFDNSYQNVLNFTTKQHQENYFNSKIVMTFENTTYTRSNRGVKINASYNDLLNYNYIQFDNLVGGVSKRFYAFINDIVYISPSVTEIIFEIDVMQTYMFDYEIKESFVEREHQNRWFVKNDKLLPIFNLTDENIDYGSSYVLKNNEILKDYDEILTETNSRPVWYYIISTEKIGTVGDIAVVNGVDTGVYVYLLPNIYSTTASISPQFKLGEDTNASFAKEALNIRELTNNSNIISISASRYSPFKYIYENNVIVMDPPIATSSFRVSEINDKYIFSLVPYRRQNEITISLPPINVQKNLTELNIENTASIDLETKLYTNPYSFHKIRMNDEELIFNIENFKDVEADRKLKVLKTFSMKNTTLVWLDNYLAETQNLSHARATANDNEITLRRDTWEQYERNNKATLKSGLISGVLQTTATVGIGVATGGIGLAVAGTSAINTAFGIYNELQKRNDIKQQSDNVVNAIGDISLNAKKNELFFGLESYEIDPSFKQKIFRYLLHFGYKTSEFKKPKLDSRYYYNYIKTIGVNIVGNINNNILTTIKNIFNNGVTLWHYREENTFKGIGNYDYENVETELEVV